MAQIKYNLAAQMDFFKWRKRNAPHQTLQNNTTLLPKLMASEGIFKVNLNIFT